MRFRPNRFAAIFLIGFAAFAFADAPSAVSVGGVVDHPGDFTVDRIKHDLSADVRSIDFISHGDKHTADCVPLLSLLKAAGAHLELKMDPKADPKAKNHALRMVVIVKAGDGYTVSFAAAELLPDIGDKAVWVAFDLDGQPLPEKDQPVRLIVPDDKKPGRWVHGVTSVQLVDPSNAGS